MAIIKGKKKPLPTKATSSDGKLRVTAADAGVVVKTIPGKAEAKATRVRIFRNGKPIYGADTAHAVKGVATVLDLYVPYGTTSTWQARFYAKNGSIISRTRTVSLTLPDLFGHEGGDIWLKADSGGTWEALRANITPEGAAQYSGSSSHSLQYAYGASLPGGSFETARPQPETWEIWTQTYQEMKSLRNILGRGMFYRQVPRWYGFEDQWMVYVDHTESMPPTMDLHTSRERYTTIQMQPISAPSTVDSPKIGVTRSRLAFPAARTYPGTDLFPGVTA